MAHGISRSFRAALIAALAPVALLGQTRSSANGTASPVDDGKRVEARNGLVTSANALAVYELQAKEFTGYWSGVQDLDTTLANTAAGMAGLLK